MAAQQMRHAIVQAVRAIGMDGEAERDERERRDGGGRDRGAPSRRHRAGAGHEGEVRRETKPEEPRRSGGEDPRAWELAEIRAQRQEREQEPRVAKRCDREDPELAHRPAWRDRLEIRELALEHGRERWSHRRRLSSERVE